MLLTPKSSSALLLLYTHSSVLQLFSRCDVCSNQFIAMLWLRYDETEARTFECYEGNPVKKVYHEASHGIWIQCMIAGTMSHAVATLRCRKRHYRIRSEVRCRV